VGEEPNNTTTKSLVLYKSFNTLLDWELPSPVIYSLVRRYRFRDRRKKGDETFGDKKNV
jgi:hypothetical protein